MDLNCPYCNSIISFDSDFSANSEGVETTPCCSRTIVVWRKLEPTITLGAPVKSYLQNKGVEGDISRVPDMPKLDHMRSHSRWTVVVSTGGQWFVKLAPKHVELEKLGRPWGISLANTYSSPFEAHRFADSIDQFLDAVFSENSSLYRSYMELLTLIAYAKQNLNSDNLEEIASIFSQNDELNAFNRANSIEWVGGHEVFTNISECALKIEELKKAGMPFKLTQLYSVNSERNVQFFPNRQIYDEATEESERDGY